MNWKTLMASRFTDKELLLGWYRSQSWWSANCLYLSLPTSPSSLRVKKGKFHKVKFDELISGFGLRKDVVQSQNFRKNKDTAAITLRLFVYRVSVHRE